MKKYFLLISAVILLALVGCQKDDNNIITPSTDEYTLYKSGDIISGQYIVLFEQDAVGIKSRGAEYQVNLERVSNKAYYMLKNLNVEEPKLLYIYASAIEGFAINLTESEADILRKQPGIKVYHDKVVVLEKPSPDPVLPPPQTIPYGILRVGGPVVYTGTNKAWIIDTGIDLDHPDLNVNQTLGKNMFDESIPPEDDNGHGSHCAGIVAAKDDTIGVVGVAAGAEVVPVKVLDRRGFGPWSVIIAGIDYVASTAEPGDVANLSLGGSIYEPVDLAVINLGDAGIYVSLAAGNSRKDANNYSPARVNGENIYTVSACDKYDVWAYFSNYGNPPIDFCAPGVYVYSTYKNGGYATMSGTSMSAPHVSGLLLITNGNVSYDGYVINDPDGNPDPIAHKGTTIIKKYRWKSG